VSLAIAIGAFVAWFIFGVAVGALYVRRKLLVAWAEVKCREEDADARLHLAQATVAHGEALAAIATRVLEQSGEEPSADGYFMVTHDQGSGSVRADA
jgi:hypothetical protein